MSGLRPFAAKGSGLLDNMEEQDSTSPGSSSGSGGGGGGGGSGGGGDDDGRPLPSSSSYKTHPRPRDASSPAPARGDHHHDDSTDTGGGNRVAPSSSSSSPPPPPQQQHQHPPFPPSQRGDSPQPEGKLHPSRQAASSPDSTQTQASRDDGGGERAGQNTKAFGDRGPWTLAPGDSGPPTSASVSPSQEPLAARPLGEEKRHSAGSPSPLHHLRGAGETPPVAVLGATGARNEPELDGGASRRDSGQASTTTFGPSSSSSSATPDSSRLPEAAGKREKSPPRFSAHQKPPPPPQQLQQQRRQRPQPQPPPPTPPPPSSSSPPSAALDDSDSSVTAADTVPLIPSSSKKRPSSHSASTNATTPPTSSTTTPGTSSKSCGRGGSGGGGAYGAMEKNGDGGWSPYTSKTDMVPEDDKATPAGPNQQEGNRRFVYVLACFATLGGLLFGYDTGIVSGSMLLLKPYFDLSTVWQEIIVSGTIGAAAFFALMAGFFCDWLGRKKVIMAASFVFVVGAFVMAVADSKELLLGGRIIVGVGIGFASMTVPVYVAEAAPPDIRGRLVTLNQLFITIGILLSSVIAGAFSSMKGTGWRYMLGIAGVPGLIQFIGFFFLPESPRWLISKGRDEEAKAVLRRIRGHNNIDGEYQDVKDAEANKQTGFVLGQIIKTPHVRKALFVGCGLQLFQQLCGINTVIYYSATILKMAGFPPEQAIWLVCVPFGVNFLSTFIGVWAVERLGRKILLLLSFVGVTIAVIVLAVGFYLSAEHSPSVNGTMTVTFANGTLVSDECQAYSICEDCILNDKCGYCYDDNQPGAATCLLARHDDEELYSAYGRCRKDAPGASGEAIQWSYGYCPTDYTWMAVLGLALFVFSFAPGLGPMPWTINSEIYPMWARSTANSIATTTNWVFNLVVSFSFLTLLETITKYGTFFLFTGICALGFIFTALFVPETRNKTLEEVEEVFMTPELREQHKRERLAAREITVEDPTDVSGIDTKF